MRERLIESPPLEFPERLPLGLGCSPKIRLATDLPTQLLGLTEEQKSITFLLTGKPSAKLMDTLAPSSPYLFLIARLVF